MNGIPKGLCSFGRVQRQRLWRGSRGRAPYYVRRPLVERMIVATIIRILWDVEDAVPYIMLNYDLIRQRELSCLPYISVLDNYGKIVCLGVGLISEVTAVIVAVHREHYLVRGT